MKIYKSYIIDDEPLAIVSLRKKLENFPEIEIVGESTKMAKAIKDINANPPDLLFLDIQLDQGNGFDLLDEVEYSGKVIFVTAYDEYAFRAFEVNALDYLLKPISVERLKTTIDKLNQKTEKFIPKPSNIIRYNYNDRIMAFDKNQIRFVLLENIQLITAARDYSTIETMDGRRILMMRTMSEWEERLPQEHFIRIHRSYIINLNHIDKILRYSTSSAKVYIKNHPEPVTISRSYYKDLKNRYL